MELQNERHIWSVRTPEGGADRLHTRDFTLNFEKKQVTWRDFVLLYFKTLMDAGFNVNLIEKYKSW